MKTGIARALCALAVTCAAAVASAEPTRVVVTIENLAPARGTFQTPFWVGFHDGEAFDTYDGNTPASSNPLPGSRAMEAICEDGDTAPLSADFAVLSAGVDATLPGPDGPIAPGDVAEGAFVLESTDPDARYFSYASMVLPSNDFCVSNGNPRAHEIFDADGNFVGASFFIVGSEVLDAGTEVNDELPENTAFFGQAAPDTGVDEFGNIGDAGDLADFAGFLPADARLDPPTILGTGRFAMGDFTARGYPIAKISFAAAPAVVDDLRFVSELDGAQEVPAVRTRARGWGDYRLSDGGTRLRFEHRFRRLRNVTLANLHLGAAGENGPVVASLLPADFDAESPRERRDAARRIRGELGGDDLVGPLAGQPLDALIAAIEAGEVYVDVTTRRFPDGEIRGQLELP